jgi:lysophospholipase L1-like esterase
VPGAYLPLHRWNHVGRRELRFDVQINSLGYRGAEPIADRDNEALRIVFVGDSLVFGDFVADDETWPAQLQAALVCPRPVVVYNAGIPGTTLTESIPMAARARALHPDVIVSEFTLANDLEDLTGPPLWSRMEARRNAGPAVDMVVRALHHSALWNTVRQAMSSAVAGSRRNNLHADGERLAQAQRTYEQLLSGWVAQLEKANLPLVFALFPGYAMLAERDRSLQEWAIGAAERAGLRPVDLWPALYRDGRAPAELYFVPRDQHPSAKGYAIAARAVAEAIVAQIASFKGCSIAASH